MNARKMLGLILSIIICLAIAVPAFAEDVVTDNTNLSHLYPADVLLWCKFCLLGI